MDVKVHFGYENIDLLTNYSPNYDKIMAIETNYKY